MKKFLITTLVALLPLLSATEAQAGCDVCNSVMKMAADLLTALNQSTAQITAEIEKQMAAEKSIKEAEIAWQAQKDFQYKAADVKRDQALAPNVCNTANAGRNLASADQDARASAAAGTADAMNRNLNTKSISKYLGDRYKKHQALAHLGGADVRADGLFAPTGTDGKPALTYTPDQVEAAKEFAARVTNPLPTPALDPELEKTPQGKAFATMQLAEQARLSMSDYSLSQIRSRYEPQTDLGARICQSWNSLYDQYNQSAGLNALPPCTLPKDASVEAVMDFLVGMRMTPQWVAMISGSSPSAVQREQAIMSAFQIWMDYKGYQQMSRMEGLMAGGLAASSGDSMRGMLSAQRTAAAQAAAGGNAREAAKSMRGR